MLLRNIFFLVVLNSFMPSHAVIFGMQWWKMPDGKNVILYSDGHPIYPNSKGNCTNNILDEYHRLTIVKLAQTHDAFVIVEDLLGYQGSHKSFQKKFSLSNDDDLDYTDTCISGLMYRCKQAGVECFNAECRYASHEAIENALSVQELLSFNDKMIREIQAYNDGAILNQAYASIINAVLNKDSAQLIEQYYGNPKPVFMEEVFQSMGKKQNEKMQQFAQDFIYYDAGLVDARMLHALHNQKDKKTIFMCAGQLHINVIVPILQSLGGVKVKGIEKTCVEHKGQIKAETVLSVWELENFIPSPQGSLHESAAASSSSASVAAAPQVHNTSTNYNMIYMRDEQAAQLLVELKQQAMTDA